MSQRTSPVAWVILILFVISLIMCMGALPGLDLIFYLIAGWARYLGRVIPQTHVRYDLLISAGVYILIFIAGGHLFVRWLYREMNQGPPGATWKIRWTLAAFALIALMFFSGTAFTGIIHQINWLARSPEPMFRSSSERANRVKCASNLRQIGQGLALYRNDHDGRYPDDLRPLIVECDLSAEVLTCPSSNDEKAEGQTLREAADRAIQPGHCSYFYLGKGLVDPVEPDKVIAVERMTNHEHEGMNVLYADGHVDWLDRQTAEALLEKLGFERTVPPPKH